MAPISPIKRKKWAGTDIFDGTGFVKMKFATTVLSLPYSTQFNTIEGVEYFRVIHDNQQRPVTSSVTAWTFKCFKCNAVGHYARECGARTRQQQTEGDGDEGEEMDVRAEEKGEDAAVLTDGEQEADPGAHHPEGEPWRGRARESGAGAEEKKGRE